MSSSPATLPLSKQPVVDMQMQPAAVGVMGIIERLASDPNFDTAKLEKLIELHERSEDRVAKNEFSRAMSLAQAEMRSIATDAYNPATKSRYASYAAIDKPLRPIYTKHGFGLSFNTGETPLAEHVRILCDVSHSAGYSVRYHVDMPSDGKGARGGDVMTKTHATGAAIAYGMRYLVKMIFNVAVGEDDTDGNQPAAVRAELPKPAKYDEFIQKMQSAAVTGLKPLADVWKAATKEQRAYADAQDGTLMDELQAAAEEVDKK